MSFRPSGVDGLEVVGIRELAGRMTVGADGRPHRVGFHVFTVVCGGTGRREVDFREVVLRPGAVLWVRPDQVQRFEDRDLEGVHVLATEAFLASLPAADALPVHGVVHATDRDAARSIRTIIEEVAGEAERADPSRMVLQLLLRTVVALVTRAAAQKSEGRAGDPIAQRFRAAVETSFTELHVVAEYARALGYSTRTVSRAVREATGQSPKQLIDRRIALEAQRLFAYTDLPVARIAERLGFTEATNFSRFFQRTTGISASEFRAEHRQPRGC